MVYVGRDTALHIPLVAVAIDSSYGCGGRGFSRDLVPPYIIKLHVTLDVTLASRSPLGTT